MNMSGGEERDNLVGFASSVRQALKFDDGIANTSDEARLKKLENFVAKVRIAVDMFRIDEMEL